MAKRKHNPKPRPRRPGDKDSTPVGLRIIGGTFRGRRLQYAGDTRVRPMKDRVREALFNLVGPSIKGKYAVDLFGGTGAIGLEAISRGAVGVTFLECHYPTARVLRENIATLAAGPLCNVIVADTFAWLAQGPTLSPLPWVVFISPPYEFFESRQSDMLRLIETILEKAAPESIVVVESDNRFDFSALGEPQQWDVRNYPPARIGIFRKPVGE